MIGIEHRITDLRTKAAKKRAEADRLDGSLCRDPAYLTQPIQPNTAGRRLAAQRERDRNRIVKVMALRDDAAELERKARDLEANGPRVAGAAAARRAKAVAECTVSVGQVVNSIYGARKVIKVNAKTVLIEGAFGPLKIEKHLIFPAAP